MSILSVTFHNTPQVNEQWVTYLENDLDQMIENLIDVEKYILSEVESDMITEGSNTNLLLVFDSEEKRQDFVEIELKNISERVEKEFGSEVMIFLTHLNPKKLRF